MGESSGNVKAAGGGPVAQALGSKGQDLVSSDPRAGSTYRLTEDSGSLKPRPDAVPDQRPLELADGGHNVEDQLAGRSRGVDIFLDRDEGDPAAAQVVEGLDQLLD
jgi:hypothetical protein